MSNCGAASEQYSMILNHHLKKVIQKRWSYIEDSGYFIKKINNLDSIPKNAILLTADMVDLYPSTPHHLDLTALTGALTERDEETIPTNVLLKIAEFVLKNNYFKFGNKIKHQISGTAVGTKFSQP